MLRSRVIPCLLIHKKGLVKTVNFKEPKYKFLKKLRLYHWSHAEPCLFLKKLVKYNLNTIFNTLPWTDLMEVFKK